MVSKPDDWQPWLVERPTGGYPPGSPEAKAAIERVRLSLNPGPRPHWSTPKPLTIKPERARPKRPASLPEDA